MVEIYFYEGLLETGCCQELINSSLRVLRQDPAALRVRFIAPLTTTFYRAPQFYNLQGHIMVALTEVITSDKADIADSL